MESLCDIAEELCSGYGSGSWHWVHITYIINPHKFYVRPCKYDSRLQYLESSRLTNEESTIIRNHKVVAFRSNMNAGKIIRGQIVSITGTELSISCEIYALDYGFVVRQVPVEDIYKCNKHFISVPGLVLQCSLYMSQPKGRDWSHDAIRAFTMFLGAEKAKICVQQRIFNKFIVAVTNTCPEDISSMMISTGFSIRRHVDPLIKRLAAAPRLSFYFRQRELDDILHVRMLYGKKLNEFYVAELSEYQDFLKLINDINFHASREEQVYGTRMSNGGPALVYNESHLKCSHRGEIECFSFSPLQGTVRLVDTGKRVIVKRSNIKHIPQQLMTHPAAAIYCSTQAIPIEVRREDFFLPGFEFYITIQKVGKDLTIPNFVKVELSTKM